MKKAISRCLVRVEPSASSQAPDSRALSGLEWLIPWTYRAPGSTFVFHKFAHVLPVSIVLIGGISVLPATVMRLATTHKGMPFCFNFKGLRKEPLCRLSHGLDLRTLHSSAVFCCLSGSIPMSVCLTFQLSTGSQSPRTLLCR